MLSEILARQNKGIDDPFLSIYKEDVVKYKEDPLVLACTLKKILSETDGSIHFSMGDSLVTESITEADRNHAEAVRKYYTKKWFWASLSNAHAMSDFRSRCCYLLENRVRDCKDKDSGIYYKLPWFYDEDMIYDEFKKQYKTTYEDFVNQRPNRSAKQILNLTYLKSTVSRQQKRKLERFWFTDNTYLYNIEVTQDNPLIDMFRSMISPGQISKFESYITFDRIDQMHFHKLYRFNFIKE
jgi:hypothetical protein